MVAELLPYETICGHLAEELFQDVQDRQSLLQAIAAARDPKLWSFLRVAGRKVILRVEGVRHWSMVCNCPHHVQERRDGARHQECPRNSMRLSECYDFLQNEVAAVKREARELTPLQTDNSESLCRETRHMLEKYASLLHMRTKYFGLIPWRFATADTKKGAAACLEQLEAVAIDRLDPLSRRIAENFRQDLEVVADGGPVSPGLQHEVNVIKCSPLDESAGEGYHRGSNMEHLRSPHASTQTVVQKVRCDVGYERLEQAIATFGKPMRNTIRYEWRNWKRILQSEKKKLHRNVNLTADAAYARIYRQDSMGRDNWDLVLNPRAPDEPSQDDDPDVDSVQREYMKSLFQPKQYFSVEHGHAAPPVPPVLDDADLDMEEPPPPDTGPQVFRVIGAHGARNRPKLMHTHESYRDPLLHAPIVFELQFYEWRTPYSVETGSAVIYPSMDPIWITLSKLATFEDIVYRTFRFYTATDDPEHQGCLVVSDRRVARPQIPLTDERCPVLCIFWYLQGQGWHYVKAACEHTLENIDKKVLDGRDLMRHKLYYMVLCKLEKVLRLTSSVPSTQTQLFYRLLLCGKRVEPGLPLQDYIDLAGGKRKILPLPVPEPGVDVEPLEIEPPPFDEDLVVAAEAPGPKAKRPRPKAPAVPLPKAEAAPPEPPQPPTVPLPAPGGAKPPHGPLPPDPLPPPPIIYDPPEPAPDEDLVVAAAHDVEVARARAPQRLLKWRDAVGGGKIRFDLCKTPDGTTYPNFKIRCLRCPKSRTPCEKTWGATPRNTARHGMIEALAYVHAWRPVPITDPTKTHRNHDPSTQEVDDYLAANRPALEALLEECGLGA